MTTRNMNGIVKRTFILNALSCTVAVKLILERLQLIVGMYIFTVNSYMSHQCQLAIAHMSYTHHHIISACVSITN